MLEQKIAECEFDLFEFGRFFMGAFFKVESSDFHKELTLDYQNAILHGDQKKLCRLAPRGNAKSVWTTLILPLWCILYGHRKFIVIISDSSEQADGFLTDIREQLENNQLIFECFGSQTGPVWQHTKLVTITGAQISSLGVGKKIRGKRKGENRPDLVICDDVENDENVASREQRKKLKSWYLKAVLKAGDRSTVFIVVGTAMHHDSLLAVLQKNSGFESKVYKSVIEFSSSPRWGEWERIYINRENKDRKKLARVYYQDYEGEMLKGTKVLWPEWESYYDLMEMRLTDGEASFSSEKQNNPINEDDCIFSLKEEEPRHWFDFDDLNALMTLRKFMIRGAIDPSMGKNMDRGDYSAIITGGKDPSTGYVYILDADIKRRHPDVIIEDTINKTNSYVYNLMGVEEVAFQEFFKDSFIKEVAARDLELSLPIVGVPNSGTKKSVRIQRLQPMIANGTIKFHKSQKLLIEQLQFYPKIDHDDGPDALEMLMRLFKGSENKLVLPTKERKRRRRGLDTEF